MTASYGGERPPHVRPGSAIYVRKPNNVIDISRFEYMEGKPLLLKSEIERIDSAIRRSTKSDSKELFDKLCPKVMTRIYLPMMSEDGTLRERLATYDAPFPLTMIVATYTYTSTRQHRDRFGNLFFPP